jgi:predicted SprT family Zn-dependent metalloprotease
MKSKSSSTNRPRGVIPPLRPNLSGDVDQTRERFDALLPKYGFLWRSMANSKLSTQQRNTVTVPMDEENTNPSRRNVVTKQSKDTTEELEPSLLGAILNKKAVSISVRSQEHDLCGDDCNCADPILEIDDDENNSVFDADEKDNGGANQTALLFAEDSDDESIHLDSTKKTSRKKKAFILESDDEDDLEIDKSLIVSQQETDSDDAESSRKSTAVVDDLSDFNPSLGDESEDTSASSKRSAPVVTRRNPTRRTKAASSFSANNDMISDSDDDKSSSSEEEWDGEISSDEKEVEQPRANRVIILSDDDEYDSESEVEDDNQSAFTISDDDDDCSSESNDSDASSIRKSKTKTNSPPIRQNTKSPRIPRKRAVLTTPKTTKSTSSQSRVVNFDKSRDNLASKTFAEFNQLAFENQLSSVKVEWSKKLNTTAGVTRMKGKLGDQYSNTRVATIELATKVIENEEQLRSTLLHEMCHAAAWLVDGVHKPPHGKVFKQWASRSMKKITDVEVMTTHDYHISYKFAWACTNARCNVVIKRHSKSVDPNKHCCGKCKNKLIEIEVPGKGEDISNNAFTPKKQRKTSEFALFVKKHSGNIREKLAKERSCSPKEVPQADVMKECGAEWQRRKQGSSSNPISELINLTLG